MEDVLFLSIVQLLLVFLFARMLIKGDQRRAAKIEAEKLAKDAETFRDNVTSEDLDEIASSVRKSILRLKRLTVSEHVFYGTVQASSGLSEWSFSLDFDCRGHLSTQCKRKQDNKKSKIPAVVEDRILEKIELYNSGKRPAGNKARAESSHFEEVSDDGYSEFRAPFCPYCGQRAVDSEAVYCAACGKRLPLVK